LEGSSGSRRSGFSGRRAPSSPRRRRPRLSLGARPTYRRGPALERRGYLAIAIALSVPSSLAAAQGAGPAVTAARDVYAAISRADTVALRALLSAELRWVLGSSGTVATKQQLLRAASSAIPDVRLD